jgi:F-type H+-transporting ATPase subunit b
MPQLNFANPLTTSQVVWMVLIFLGLYYVLSRHALPQVGAVLAERAAKIGADIEAARQAKAQADHAVRELTEGTARARAEAQAQIKTAADDAKGRAAAEAALATARLETQLQAAEARIAAARTAAMAALRDVATETATTLVTRLTGHKADAKAVGAAVDQVLAARGQG